MRYLNKIVFINSASVKYAEIELDGNVHLTGTQGVGKSTLLRAILFFYNANKSKLGIPSAKKGFDDYYFQFQNSYIIYEVMKEGVPFCVLAYKLNGKVAYRFIDSGFNKALFIDESGRALDHWDKIRAVLGKKIHSTKAITSYNDYRKILYGDHQGVKPEFRRYALVESKQYQNIPLTIQNVLLNSNLEAKFIKDTIINSISEDEFTIDLANYAKSHLRDFESEINDIKIWSEVGRNGRIDIRDRAQSVIEHFRVLNFLQREKLALAHKLAARMVKVREEKPELISACANQKARLEALVAERIKLESLHRAREQRLIAQIEIIKDKLREAQKKHKVYENKDIHTVIDKVAKEEALLREARSITEEQTLLNAKFTEINHKYDALITQLSNQQNSFENEQRAEINRLESQFTNDKLAIIDRFAVLIENVASANKEAKVKADNELQLLVEREHGVKRTQAELKHKRFFAEEITQVEQAANDLKMTIFTSKTKIDQLKLEVATLRDQWRREKESVEKERELKIDAELKIKEDHLAEIAVIEKNLSEGQSTFYGWLNEAVPGWESSIGKVVDREVLFNTNLSPKKSTPSDSLYGVEVNLNALEQSVKTVEEYQADIKRLKDKVAVCQQNIQAIYNEEKNQLESLKRKFGGKINRLGDQQRDFEYQLAQSTQTLKENSLTMDEWLQKAQTEKNAAYEACELQLEKLALLKEKATAQVSKIQKAIKSEITRKERERDRMIAEAQIVKENGVAEIAKAMAKNKGECNQRIAALKQKKNYELGEKGADIQRLNAIESRLKEINDGLVYIKNNRTLVSDYQKDKRELFDLIPEFKANQAKQEKKLKSQHAEQQAEMEKCTQKERAQQEVVEQLLQAIAVFDTDLEAYEAFEKSEVFQAVQFIFCDEPEPLTVNEEATKLIEQINGKHFGVIKKYQELQQAVNRFTSGFDENNVFRFKVKFTTEEDYFTFAKELKEFIEEDKVSEFEKRVNERFAHIIHQISHETQELISKEAEIEKIIKKINGDFVNRNFVEAIKQMEMRMQASSNPVVKLLLKIKQFCDENFLDLGEDSLFSTSDHGKKNRQAVELLKQLLKALERYKNSELTLSESFDLQFRIVENDNDSGWVEKLSNVGSEGTDVLVKAMVNILLLNVFKENASKKFKDFKLHCMMDEIGRLHPSNVRGILRFANDRNILLINGSPTSQNATDYKQTYKLSKEQSKTDHTKYITRITRLVKVVGQVKK